MAKDPILTIAESLEPKMKRALIKAWNEVRKSLSLNQIETALQNGGVQGVMDLLDGMGLAINSELGPLLDEAIIRGGQSASIIIPSEALNVAGELISFNPFNPNTVDYVNRYKLDLIREIDANTREGVRQGLSADLIAGRNPRNTARDFRNNIGLTAKQEQAVRNYRNSLEDLNSDALNRALRDKRFDSTVRNAINTGKPLSQSQIDNMVNRYRSRYIAYRAEVIARTESLRATTIGNRQGMMQMINNGELDYDSVRRHWVYNKDKRTRDAHRKIPGMNPEGVLMEEPYKTPLGDLMYPRDPAGTGSNTVQCRCLEKYKVNPDWEGG